MGLSSTALSGAPALPHPQWRPSQHPHTLRSLPVYLGLGRMRADRNCARSGMGWVGWKAEHGMGALTPAGA